MAPGATGGRDASCCLASSCSAAARAYARVCCCLAMPCLACTRMIACRCYLLFARGAALLLLGRGELVRRTRNLLLAHAHIGEADGAAAWPRSCAAACVLLSPHADRLRHEQVLPRVRAYARSCCRVDCWAGVELAGAELATGVACELVLLGKKEEKQLFGSQRWGTKWVTAVRAYPRV